nr:immunoglobulin heavy chain junction region [Mus musculus]
CARIIKGYFDYW